MKIKRLIGLPLVLLCILLITGCTGKKGSSYTYKLDKMQYWDVLYVSQTTYYDNRVEIVLSGGRATENFKFFSPDDRGAVTDKMSTTLIIYSDNPTDITSLNIIGSLYRLEFRYLNTEEYVCIWRLFASELGWSEYYGDTGRFFTKEEKEQQIEEKRNNCTREYFENLDKESSLEQIVEDLGPYGISGSGILYHVWHLNDGTRAEVVFDSKGNIVRIYIIGDENSELIYEREY